MEQQKSERNIRVLRHLIRTRTPIPLTAQGTKSRPRTDLQRWVRRRESTRYLSAVSVLKIRFQLPALIVPEERMHVAEIEIGEAEAHDFAESQACT